MEARFEINYYYLPGEEYPCKATITITLPAQEGLLVPLLRSTKRIHQPLNTHWGTYQNEESRSAQISVYAQSWDELEQKVSDQITGVASLLQQIVADNLRMLEQKPVDRVVEINLLKEE